MDSTKKALSQKLHEIRMAAMDADTIMSEEGNDMKVDLPEKDYVPQVVEKKEEKKDKFPSFSEQMRMFFKEKEKKNE